MWHIQWETKNAIRSEKWIRNFHGQSLVGGRDGLEFLVFQVRTQQALYTNTRSTWESESKLKVCF